MDGNFIGTSIDWLFVHCFQVEFEFRNVVYFVEGGQLEYPEKPLGAGTRTNNKLNPHMTSTPGIEAGPNWWEASALTTAPSLLP